MLDNQIARLGEVLTLFLNENNIGNLGMNNQVRWVETLMLCLEGKMLMLFMRIFSENAKVNLMI